MSAQPWLPDNLEIVVVPPTRDLGDGFTVRRALPSAARQMVGPFIFFDQMGPVSFHGGNGLDVRPHPHIGLSTLTYLLEGEIVHRDSLGVNQTIRPGEINWMTAGRGIVHSERTDLDARRKDSVLSGLQVWIALPTQYEETRPSFDHLAAGAVPTDEDGGVRFSLIAGRSGQLQSPVKTLSDLVYAELQLQDGARYKADADHIERAFYVIDGEIEVIGQTGTFGAGQLVVLKPHAEVIIRSSGFSRVMFIGGEPFPEPRHVYWNFVSSRPDRIEHAKEEWRLNLFPHVPDEVDFIPLPAE